MAKIGSTIQETRLRKGLTLERIADDTNISIRFLFKIENDDFSGFPGEPYVVGFIRNYAEYLGLDPEATVARYRNKDEESRPATAVATPDKSEVVKAIGETAPPKNVAAPAPGEAIPKPAKALVPEPAKVDSSVQASAVGQTAVSSGEESGNAAMPAQAEREAPKAKKARKTKPVEASIPQGDSGDKPRDAVEKPADSRKEEVPASEPHTIPLPENAEPAKLTLRMAVIGILAISIVAVAVFWIVAGGRTQLAKQSTADKEPTEYRVEGSPFEMRLYTGDSLLVPIGGEVYKLRLASIGETVDMETPFGPFKLALGETGALDIDKDGSAEASLIVGDFEKNRAASGALLKVEFSPADPGAESESEVTVPETEALATAIANLAGPKTDTVIVKSTRGPYPFVVQVAFRGNCLLRYEADKKEWVEKYYSKGENITLNINNGLIVWASNAQAVKLNFQASGGKTADLEIGAPGEIAVKKISWTRDGSSWALISSNLD
ncbi:MAG TPA: helix-turn-helix domain-containing protein [Rectinemataceae bacterium]|nr:helix-turn-helix domain-containing protein [Rectinemataceae bacterium]